MTTPRCEIVADPKPQWSQTYVIKTGALSEPEVLKLYAFKSDAHAVAILSHTMAGETVSCFLVLSFRKGSNVLSTVRHIKEGLGELGVVPETVGPLTQRFQSLFAWDAVDDAAPALMDADPAAEAKANVIKAMTPTLVFAWQHPLSPVPYFVIKQEKPFDNEKLAWIFQQIPKDTEIHEFCLKFLQLFGSGPRTPTTEVAQKNTAKYP